LRDASVGVPEDRSPHRRGRLPGARADRAREADRARLASARELGRIVLEVFDEQQVFRIDHYLGKEAVQNILVFRFANSMVERA
jgi:hypothetical protein